MTEHEMKTKKKNPCRACSYATLHSPARSHVNRRVCLLVDAACAARAGAAQMTLGDWHEVELEVKRKLQNEC